jgi:hypothetical protein
VLPDGCADLLFDLENTFTSADLVGPVSSAQRLTLLANTCRARLKGLQRPDPVVREALRQWSRQELTELPTVSVLTRDLGLSERAFERRFPIVAFWKKLDLPATTQAPDPAAADGRLAFVIFAATGVEIMYQTAASVRDDLLESASEKEAIRQEPQQTTLFVEVERLADIESRLHGERLIMPRRKTFYGTTEVAYLDPAGNVVIFAEHTAS